ncbi:MAG: DMT family transporter [Planctomycetota bacterium]
MFDGLEGRGGELAALATAMCWAGSALIFGAAARRRGAALLNFLRLALACVFLLVTVLATGQSWDVSSAQLGFLLVSGVIGLALGDAAYFRCLQILGPRRAALTMSFAPALTALLMVPLLGETIGLVGITGMALTLGGIVWVHNEKDHAREIEGSAGWGLTFGILGALGQAVGLIFAKAGLGTAPAESWLAEVAGLAVRTLEDGTAVAGEAVTPLYGTLLRMLAALVGLLAAAAVGWRPGWTREALRDGKFLGLTAAGTVTGPFVGVWLSLVAVSMANTAVAATIMAASPIFVIPLMRIVYGHSTSARAWLGAAVAIGGVALLTFRDAF